MTSSTLQQAYDETEQDYDLKSSLNQQINSGTNNNLTREGLAAGYEIGAGIGFDILTAPLGWAPPLYAAANFVEGGLSNIIGQKIRGEKGINWKEVLSSAALGVVPLTQLKAGRKLNRIVGEAGTIRRAGTAGAFTGVADQTIQAGLGGELPTKEQVLTGAAVGGVVGTSIGGLAYKLNKAIQRKALQYDTELIDEVLSNPDVVYPPGSIEAKIQKEYQAMAPKSVGAAGNPNKPGDPTSVEGTIAQRMEAAINEMKRLQPGSIRRDGTLRPNYVAVTSRIRGRAGNADLVNAFSNRKDWNREGAKRTEAIVEGLTARERELIGRWEKHHKRPLSQHSWLLQDLPDAEVDKATEYSYKRMAAGGDVLNNQRIVFERAHDKTHIWMNTFIGQMRSGAGKSIKGLLDPPGSGGIDTINKFLALDTFEARKPYISRFFDYTDFADEKVGRIMNAVDVSRENAPTLSLADATRVFNTIDDAEDLSILDDFLVQLNKLMDPTDLNSLAKINEKLNQNEADWLPLITEIEPLRELIEAGKQLSRTKAKRYKYLVQEINKLEIAARILLDRKEALIPDQAQILFNRRMNELQRSRRGGIQGVHTPSDYGQD